MQFKNNFRMIKTSVYLLLILLFDVTGSVPSGEQKRSPENQYSNYGNGSMAALCNMKKKCVSPMRDSPNGTMVFFHLFSGGEEKTTLDINDLDNLKNSNFDKNKVTRIIVHGFMSSSKESWVQDMKTKLIQKTSSNVILVDWKNGAGSNILHYWKAIKNLQTIADHISRLIFLVCRLNSLSEKDFHIIGHSLGAHVAGLAGKALFTNYGKAVGRITGLDPAGPWMEDKDFKSRLHRGDADFVDVIHTNGGWFIYGHYGSEYEFGDIDFYPNGGKDQPGCFMYRYARSPNLEGAKDRELNATHGIVKRSSAGCDHLRAALLYTASIDLNCVFTSYPCASRYESFAKGECFDCGQDEKLCNKMGHYADKAPGRGKLYLKTRGPNDSPPFCSRQVIVSIETAENRSMTGGRLLLTLISKDGNEVTCDMTPLYQFIYPGRNISRICALEDIDITSLRITYHFTSPQFPVHWLHIDRIFIEYDSETIFPLWSQPFVLKPDSSGFVTKEMASETIFPS